MKKGSAIILVLLLLSFCFIIGIFIGRNTNPKFARLPVNGDKTVEVQSNQQADYRVDINTATKAQLMELPGIGEKIADQILAYRAENGKFASVEDLIFVEGIGEKKLEDIAHMIYVGG